jgi:hypothetical protein
MDKTIDITELKKYKYICYKVKNAYYKESNDIKVQKKTFEEWKKNMTFEKYQRLPEEHK